MAWFKSNKVEIRIANILKGTSNPASSIGDNGQLYLKYGLKGALLHFDDSPTSDVTGDGNSWDTYGTSPVISDTQSKFGGHSLQFSSSETGYLQTDNNETDSYMGTFDNHDFTISCWIYPTSGARQTIFAASHDCRLGVDIFYNGSSANMWMGSVNGSWNEIQSDTGGASNSGIGTVTINQNEWTHFAMTRKGDKVRSFINGQLSKEVTISSADVAVYYNDDKFRIGYWGNNGYPFHGYMDDFLILNGTALWDSAFTPPTRAFSLNDFKAIVSTYAKVNNGWQDLIGTDIDDISNVEPGLAKIILTNGQISDKTSGEYKYPVYEDISSYDTVNVKIYGTINNVYYEDYISLNCSRLPQQFSNIRLYDENGNYWNKSLNLIFSSTALTSISYTGSYENLYIDMIAIKDNGEPTPEPIVFKNYAKFDGSQGIILPWKINEDYKVEVTFYQTEYTDTENIIGNTIGGSYSHLSPYQGGYWSSWGEGEGLISNLNWSAGEHTYITNNGNNHNEFDGVEVQSYTPITMNNGYYTIGVRYGTLVIRSYIKSYKIYSISQGTLLHELVPCLYDGVTPCLYDRIGKMFFCNGIESVMDTIPTT